MREVRARLPHVEAVRGRRGLLAAAAAVAAAAGRGRVVAQLRLAGQPRVLQHRLGLRHHGLRGQASEG